VSLVRRPSLGFLTLLVLAAVAAPLLAPHDPTEMNKKATLVLPSGSNPLGTDQFGRDILSRLLYGARIALAIGIGATLAAALVGVPLGLWAGWQGGVVDGVAMRGVDTLLAIPPVLLAMGLVAMTGPGSLNAGIAVSVVGLPQFARLARAGTLGQKRMEYAEAAVALGATDRRILFRGILPNILSPIAVQVPVAGPPGRSCSRRACRSWGSARSRRRRPGGSWSVRAGTTCTRRRGMGWCRES
jgi:ABC-type dipeptide/oligopeptide/nickel transport system permease subunit